MIQVILIVFVAMLIYSFIKAKREASIIQAQRDALNEKKNKAIESLNIKEKVSTIDKEDRVFIFTEDNEVYIYNSNDGSVEKLEGIRKILSKRRYESVQAGWATCTQLRDVVLAIKLSNGEYKSEFDPSEVKNVERFEELVQQELGI